MVCGGVLALAAVGAAIVHHRRELPSCPDGYRADPVRSTRVRERLHDALIRFGGVADAKRLVQVWASDRGAWCFGPGSELREPEAILLDDRLSDGEAAARAAHLLLHALVAHPWPPAPDTSCEERVRRALAAEARAISLELELREVLLPPPTTPVERYSFAAEHRAAPAATRPGLVESHLRRHPAGAPGIPPLADMYGSRCRREATASSR